MATVLGGQWVETAAGSPVPLTSDSRPAAGKNSTATTAPRAEAKAVEGDRDSERTGAPRKSPSSTSPPIITDGPGAQDS